MATAIKRKFFCVGHYEKCETEFLEVARYRDLESLPTDRAMIAQGGGLSLTGASFGEHTLVVGMKKFNRLLALDPVRQVVHVEAGATLGKVFHFLAQHGLILPIQPGHPDITIGGCIAGNVHGKIHLVPGVFGDLVEELTLFYPGRGFRVVTPGADPELFNLTLGGLGLTGIIISARIRCVAIDHWHMESITIPVKNISQAADWMIEQGSKFIYFYSWHDLSRFDEAMGAGFLVAGGFSPKEGRLADYSRSYPPLNPAAAWPFLGFTPWALRLINGGYKKLNQSKRMRESLFVGLFPFAFMPHYFYAYGKQGFLEHQALIPHPQFAGFLEEWTALQRYYRQPMGLCALKMIQAQRHGISFGGSGISFSLHGPPTIKTLQLFEQLDALVTRHHGMTNLIKDARLSAATARAHHPQLAFFRDKRTCYDPGMLFNSMLSKRLAL